MAEDPGRAFLYIDTGKTNKPNPSTISAVNTQHEHPGVPITAGMFIIHMMSLPSSTPLSSTPGHHSKQDSVGSLDRWAVAMGNLEDARVALDTLSQAIEDAVYLDEDAYNQLIPTMQYTRLIQVCWLAGSDLGVQ